MTEDQKINKEFALISNNIQNIQNTCKYKKLLKQKLFKRDEDFKNTQIDKFERHVFIIDLYASLKFNEFVAVIISFHFFCHYSHFKRIDGCFHNRSNLMNA